MRTLLRLIKILGPILGAFSGFASLWLFLQYQQPQVVYYTDGYYSRINDLSFGSIFIVNEGRSPSINLSVFINEKLSLSDVTVDYLSTKAEISNVGNETRVTIPKLKPNEVAEIVFKSRTENRNFTVTDITSDLGDISHREWVKKSWEDLSKLQLSVIFLVITIAFGVGFLTGFIKKN